MGYDSLAIKNEEEENSLILYIHFLENKINYEKKNI